MEEKKSQSAIWVAVITGIFALCGTTITAIAGPVILERIRNSPTPTSVNPPAFSSIPLAQPSATPFTTTWTQSPVNPSPAPATVLPGGQTLLQETFDSNVNQWSIGEDENPNYGSGRREIIDGVYRFSAASKKEEVFFLSTVPNVRARDFVLTFDVTLIEFMGGVSARPPAIRIIYHLNQDSWCGVFLSDRHYMIRLSHNGVAKTLVEWAEHPAINLGQNIRNSFTIATIAGNTTVLANGQPVIAFNNENLEYDGQIKIGVAFNEASQSIVAEFDNLVVKSNP